VGQPAEAPRKITAAEKEFKAFSTLRVARANQRHEGARKARAAKVSPRLDLGSVIFNFIFSDLNRKRRRKPQRRSKPVFVVSTFLFLSCSCPPTSEATKISVGLARPSLFHFTPYAAMNMNALDLAKIISAHLPNIA
jgi:hypothetical protein